jgi:tetratricopeptide (TPR) repeat protein
VPVEFLSDEEAARFGRYCGPPSHAELEKAFFLDDADKAEVAKRRGDHNRLGFALQLTTMRYLGTFPDGPLEVPPVVVDYLSEQLGVVDPSCLKRYVLRAKTRLEHNWEIRERYHLREFSEVEADLASWADARAWTTGDGPKAIFADAVMWLRERDVLLPGVTTLARLVARTREEATGRLWEALAGLLSDEQALALDQLLEVPDGARSSNLDRWRTGPVKPSGKSLERALTRAAEAQAMGFRASGLEAVVPRRRTGVGRYGIAAKAPLLRRHPAARRHATLLATVAQLQAGFLAHMMGLQSGPQVDRLASLTPEALQRATFSSVKSVVERLASKGPTVLVLEDLHWADPISIRLTADLATLTQSVPLLLIATRRPEPSPEVSVLEATLEASLARRFRRLELSALSNEAERELARSMVGGEAAEDVIAALRHNVDGNPFFLEQRFDSLVETGALVKDATTWALSGIHVNEVPQVLERLIRSRVDQLNPIAREVVIAASVLGPEFQLSALKAVTDMSGRLTAAVNELCRAGLLLDRSWPEPVYRFRHALIQEVTYRSLLRSQRAQLHGRAAWGMEALFADRLEEVAAVLAHHYAMAGESERAVHHLQIAAGHAAADYANDEAVASYRKAIQLNDAKMTADGSAELAVELRAQLADVLWRTTRLAEARETLQQALVLVGPERPLRAASLQARLGRVEVESSFQGQSDRCRWAAMAAFDAAEELLGNYREERSDEWVDIWLEVLVDGRAHLHNYYCERERAIEVLARARPIAEVRGSPSRKAGLFVQLTDQRMIDQGGQFDEDTVVLARRALQAAEGGADEHVLAICIAALGEALLHNGELVEADEKLKAGLAALERVDDPQNRTWCLYVRCLFEVRRRDVEAVRSLSRQARDAAIRAENPRWSAAATATETWILLPPSSLISRACGYGL